MSSVSEEAPASAVVATIVVDDPADLSDTLEAVRRQVYEPARAVLVGGGDGARARAEADGLTWGSELGEVIEALDPSVAYLWVLRSGAVPRPDALGALVSEAERVDAGIAGSKVLDRDNPDTMRSVGLATDVFGVPYTGLDDDELDQGQYDVVRDVAAVAGVSLLLRRDLARGIGGADPSVGPVSAAVDLCQRARLRGARIVVVPSSEVLLASSAFGSRWKEDAGRIRSMLKVYGLLTLAWALPVLFLAGLAESILAPFTGKWRLFDWVKAWGWNLVHLPATLRMRATARRGRAAGDAELFRFQRRGSVSLAALTAEIGHRVRERLPGEDRLSLESIGRDIRQPAFVTGLIAFLGMLIAVRNIWAAGLPAVGSSAPFPDSGWQAVLAYAGGWNPAGLGSADALVPLIGVAGAVQTILFDNPQLAEYVFALGMYLVGVWGVVRLLRTWSIDAAPGTIAGVVYVAGPAAQGIAGNTDLGALFALGALPWALRVPLAPWPRTWWGRIGRVAAAGLATGVAAALSPVMLVVPVAALAVWALINIREAAAWRALVVAMGGTALGVAFLFPWAAYADLGAFLAEGAAFWETSIVIVVAVAITAVATVVAAPPRLAVVSGWGAVLATGGSLVARGADLGWGTQIENAGLAVASLGVAALVGAAVEALIRVKEVVGWRRVVVGIGSVASLFVLVSVFLPLVGGRAGLPGDTFRAAFTFTEARPGDPAASRILVVGPPSALPGDSRELRGASYRVVSAPMPDLMEVDLHEPLLGDEALAAALAEIIDGETQRAGRLLAPFGIRWVVVMGDPEGVDADPDTTAWLSVFAGQLDLVRLGGGLSHPTFANEDEGARRAITSSGAAWPKTAAGYEGRPEPDGRVVIAENGSSRWGPGEWRQAEWGSEVSAAEGIAAFAPLRERRLMAVGAGGAFVVLLGLAWWGRRRG